MESTPIRQSCIKCKKGAGTVTCGGCQVWFCTKHFLEHRQELDIQMEHIGQEHDLLYRDLNQNNGQHPLLTCIDEWEQQSMKKIQLAAEEARKSLQQYVDGSKTQLKDCLSEITKELQHSRECEDYTEFDLNNWIDQLKQLRERLENPTTISIVDDHSTQPTICLIKVRENETITPIAKTIPTTDIMAKSGKYSIVG